MSCSILPSLPYPLQYHPLSRLPLPVTRSAFVIPPLFVGLYTVLSPCVSCSIIFVLHMHIPWVFRDSYRSGSCARVVINRPLSPLPKTQRPGPETRCHPGTTSDPVLSCSGASQNIVAVSNGDDVTQYALSSSNILRSVPRSSRSLNDVLNGTSPGASRSVFRLPGDGIPSPVWK